MEAERYRLKKPQSVTQVGGKVSLKMLFLHLPPRCACDERGGGDEEMGKGLGDRKI